MKRCKHFQWVNNCVNAKEAGFVPRCNGDRMLCHLPDEQAKIVPRTVWAVAGGRIVNNKGDSLTTVTVSRIIKGIRIIEKLYKSKCEI